MSLALTRSQAWFQRPLCDCTTASQSPANNTATTADLPTGATVDNGLATTGTALLDGTNDRVYLRRPGVWQITVTTNWAANATGKRAVLVYHNTGSAILVAQNTNDNFTSFFADTMTANALVYTSTVTSFIYPQLYQASGGVLATTTTVRAVWLGAY